MRFPTGCFLHRAPWRAVQALELDKQLSTLRALSKESPELAKIVTDLENGAARARELQVKLAL